MKNFNKGEKWQDLDVTTWPIVEHFQTEVQTDGYVESESQIISKFDIFMSVQIVE